MEKRHFRDKKKVTKTVFEKTSKCRDQHKSTLRVHDTCLHDIKNKLDWKILGLWTEHRPPNIEGRRSRWAMVEVEIVSTISTTPTYEPEFRLK